MTWFMVWVVVAGLLADWVRPTEGQNCRTQYFGRGCHLKCHCQGATFDCKGVCTKCASAYTGSEPWCQRENIAINKPARQISNDLQSTQAEKAVDGDRATCSRMGTRSRRAVSWWVDLGKMKTIKWINIYRETRAPFDLEGFSLYISNTPGPSITGRHCYTHTRTMSLEQPVKVTCRVAIKGRYVVIYRQNYPLALCEVEIYECSDYTFGEQCDKQCRCHTETEKCDKITGACSSGCAAGYRGTNCQTKCWSGSFGQNCRGICHCTSPSLCDPLNGSCGGAGRCSAGWRNYPSRDDCQRPCADRTFGPGCRVACNCLSTSEVCNKVTGSCLSGCRAGWSGTDCKTACPDRTFGPGCRVACNCLSTSEVCNKVTGSCLSGCRAGWSGTDCQTPCVSGNFGQNCASVCRCRYKTQCSRIDGVCTGSCKAGWINRQGGVQNCQTPCDDGKFGFNCALDCRCRNDEICSKTSGYCRSGCRAGWRGTGCQSPCQDGKFGFKCSNRCNCKDKTEVCNKTTGACPISGCPPGKVPPDCLSSCPRGTFGDSIGDTCARVCRCLDKDNMCDGKTGRCLLPGCAVGYTGPFCQTKCGNQKFGLNCTGVCHCKRGEVCDHITGHCNDGCSPGYKGDNCSIECDNGTFGDGCAGSCNCKTVDEVCAKIDGTCVSGCPEKFEGPGCASRIKEGDRQIDVGAIVGSVIGAIILILLIILALFFFVRYKRERNEKYIKSTDSYEKPVAPRDTVSPYDTMHKNPETTKYEDPVEVRNAGPQYDVIRDIPPKVYENTDAAPEHHVILNTTDTSYEEPVEVHDVGPQYDVIRDIPAKVYENTAADPEHRLSTTDIPPTQDDVYIELQDIDQSAETSVAELQQSHM